MRWVVTVLTALVLLLALPPTLASAQPIPSAPAGKPTAADEATAKRNFESGLRLFGEGAYAEALIAFEQSYRVGGRPSALKNVAQCHRNLKHFVEAYEAYEQMLAKHGAQISPADKKAVEQALDELGVLTATVLVDVNEPDAEVELDGKIVGKAPITTPKRVAATGSHTVRVSKPGFARFEQNFTVESQQNKKFDVKLEVERLVGHLVVREQRGRDVHVFIDGQDKGPAPWEGDVPAGEHSIEAKGLRFASDARKVVIAQKERVDFALDATPLQGRLRVTTVPATASIAIDGATVGTGAWEGDLKEGPHRIEVSLPGQPPQVRDIVLGRGQLVAQEIPIITAIPTKAAPVYEGMYVRLSLFGLAGIGNRQDNAVAPFTKTEGGGPDPTAGTSLRVGRSWDWYGAEVVGMLMAENREQTYSTDQPSGQLRFRDSSFAPSAFFGAGPRVTSKDESVRFTFGIAPGVAVHWFSPRRNIEDSGGNDPNSSPSYDGNRFVQSTNPSGGGSQGGTREQDYKSASYTAFGFAMDGGILFGSTPGTKFYLGAQAMVDFAPTIVTGPDTFVPIPNEAFAAPGRGIKLVDGTQFYVGPVLGLQFGH